MAKKEFTYIENPDKITELKDAGFSNVIETGIGGAWGDNDKKFIVYWPVPETDEQAQERYNCTLADLIADGVRKLSTGPAYENVALETDSEGKFLDGKPFRSDMSDEEIQAAMQTLADNHQVGVKKEGVKKQNQKRLSKIEALAQAAGMTVDEYIDSL